MDLLLSAAHGLGRNALNRYLGEPSPRRSARRRPKRKRGGMGRSGAHVSAQVPSRSIMQGSFQGSVRNFFTVAGAATYYKSLKIGDLLGDSFAGLAAQFGEYRCNAVRLYYEPNAVVTANGLYAGAVVDTTLVGAKALSFGQVLALPGSTSRKLWQPSGYHWKWTEPSDAEFQPCNDGGPTICDFYLASNGQTNLGGDLIVDASLTLRSIAAQVSEKSILERCVDFGNWTDLELKAARDSIDRRLVLGELNVLSLE